MPEPMTMDELSRAVRNLNRRVRILEEEQEQREQAPAPAVPLTASAAKNVARGAVFGAGTNVCATCKGEKEPRRINSFRCKNCDNAGKGK